MRMTAQVTKGIYKINNKIILKCPGLVVILYNIF